MRHQIAHEGIDIGDGRVLAVGALKWRNGPIPVTMGYGNKIGWAKDILREDDGIVTAELDFEDGSIIPDDVAFTVYCRIMLPLDWFDQMPTVTIESAGILEIFSTVAVPWAPGWEKFQRDKLDEASKED